MCVWKISYFFLVFQLQNAWIHVESAANQGKQPHTSEKDTQIFEQTFKNTNPRIYLTKQAKEKKLAFHTVGGGARSIAGGMTGGG